MEIKSSLNNLRPGAAQTGQQADVIPAVTTRHRVFTLVSSIGFAALYAELMYFAYNYYGTGLSFEAVALAIAGVFVLVFVGTWVSFSLPHYIYRPRFERYSPIIFLVTEWTAAIIIVVSMTLVTFGVGIYLVGGQLGAVGELLRSLSLYAIVAIVPYHGLVTFVRYVHYLYERELHQSYKVVTGAGLSVVVLLVVTLFFLRYDLGRMGGAEPHQELLSLHLSLRDVWLIAMNMFVLFWNYARLADH
jgi:hypothetical protein